MLKPNTLKIFGSKKAKGPKHDSHNMSKLPKTKREKTKEP